MTTASNDVRKMVAKFGGQCPICDRKIKAGSDSIAYSSALPVAHYDCYSSVVEPAACPDYADAGKWAARIAAETARWEAACAAHRPRTSTSTSARAEEQGSMGGSQLAEDMGDFSGRR